MALATRFAVPVLALLLSCFALPALAQSSSTLNAVRYVLTIDGHEIASFSELAGISSQASPRQTAVVLTRPMTRNIEMAAWHELVILGDVAAARKSCSLTMFDARGTPVARYHLTDAWPAKVQIGALKAGASEVLMETVTLTAEFIQRISI